MVLYIFLVDVIFLPSKDANVLQLFKNQFDLCLIKFETFDE